MTTRPVVLVVEDDVLMNELERELLSLHGMDAVAAHTGAEAIAAVDSNSVDAVLLDVMLPEMDGLEACRRLRLRSGDQLPIVILTALDNEECRQLGFQAGANAYFTKPFDPDEVVAVLRKLIASGGNGAAH